MRFEGRGCWRDQQRCPSCDKGLPIIRCDDCYGRQLVCEDCVVKQHHRNPFHFIKVRILSIMLCLYLSNVLSEYLQRWNDRYFAPESLANLNLCVPLGPHSPEQPCPSADIQTFTIIHTNGIHTTKIGFCRCESTAVPHRVQLLRAGILPATVLDPQTGATFEAMRLFHTLSLQSKLTGYDFVHTLELLTDNTGVLVTPVGFMFP